MVDLSFLRNFSKGKQPKFERYIRLYLDLAIESYEAMETAFQANDLPTIANQAHALSPQATFMGIEGLKEVLFEIETEAKGVGNLPSLKSNIEKARLLHDEAVPVLQAALS